MTKQTDAARLQKNRIKLLLDHPFFGALLMHLQPVETKSVKTFSVDGKNLFYNPDFMAKLDDTQLLAVQVHEVLHCALLHIFRRGQRDLRRFNYAADYAINNFLDKINEEAKQKGKAEPFPIKEIGGLVDHAFDALSAEEIYNRLPEPPPQGGNGTGQGAGHASSPGEFTDAGADQAESDELESTWKVAVKQAAMNAKIQGKIPGEIERMVSELLNPKVPWSEILRTFLTSAARDDYSWARPNRRYSGTGVILPGMHSPSLGRIVVAVDTSGSIGQKEFDEFMAEVRGILFDCRPEKLVLAQCDSRLHDWTGLESFDDPAQISIKGGGGTDFRPVFARAEEDVAAGLPPAALVYLTDMMGDFPDRDPGYPVLWAATTDRQGPFGITLKIS